MSHAFLDEILTATNPTGLEEDRGTITFHGDHSSNDYFDLTGLASSSIAAAGHALAGFQHDVSGNRPEVRVDRTLATRWFSATLRPIDWQLPSIWDAFAGNYQTKDGWVRLHTNLYAHRIAAMRGILGKALSDNPEQDKQDLTAKISTMSSLDVENAVVQAGGCAAEMRSSTDWANHPQGRAVASEPLVHWTKIDESASTRELVVNDAKPLAGLRVLDMTRILAGPVATRFLAGYGADVLRIDPPGWDEQGTIQEIMLGKRSATLDLKTNEGRDDFERLIASADIFVHGLRRDALDKLGYDDAAIQKLSPGIVDIALNAYGWTGPWSSRRGFDSLVQMSSGIADHGMACSGIGKPRPLTAQALDHATGYLMAACTLQALRQKQATGDIWSARVSLARVAHLLTGTASKSSGEGLPEIRDDDFMDKIEESDWGPGRRMRFPLQLDGREIQWPGPARKLHRAESEWLLKTPS